MKLVVLAGGHSPERNVSLATGVMVCQALRNQGHEAAFVDLFFGLPSQRADPFSGPLPLSFQNISPNQPDLSMLERVRQARGGSYFGPGVLELCAQSDLVFLALHGAGGEDGRIQGTLDLLGVPYTGSGAVASAIAMDKILAKQLVSAAGISTAPWQVLRYTETEISPLARKLSLPCVIKLPQGGSTLGVYVVRTPEECQEALRACLGTGPVLAENFLPGREFTCGVLADEALPTVEIIPPESYDYVRKYQPGATNEICPGNLTEAQETEIRRLALSVHHTLGLSVYSRSDFILGEDGVFYFLEVNTLPGLTRTSLIPQEAAAVGLSYEELCHRIVEVSLAVRGRD